MMEPCDYLRDMLAYVQQIETFVTGDYAAFQDDEKTQFAVIRAYEVIGEIAKRLPDEVVATQPHVDWKQVKGFRDYLIHNYHRIRPERVWEAVEDLPNLRAAVEQLIMDHCNS